MVKTHPLYAVWSTMHQRCENPRNPKYPVYGGRGIKVCAQWSVRGNRYIGTPGFDAFVADMGLRPSPRHTLERKDTNGNYTPDNCIWATQKVQQRNRRNNHILTFRGRSQSIAAWAEELRWISALRLRARIAEGWAAEHALMTPIRQRMTKFRDFEHKRRAEAARRFRERNPGRGAHAVNPHQGVPR